jgi:hypothetical protein
MTKKIAFVVVGDVNKNLTLTSLMFDYYGKTTGISVIKADSWKSGYNIARAGDNTHALFVSAGTNLNLGITQLASDNYSNEGIGITFSRTSSDDDLMALGVVDTSKLGMFSRESIVFATGGATNYSETTERMRIDSGGNVMINTTSVVNSSRFSVQEDLTSINGIGIKNTGTTYGGSTDFIVFMNNVDAAAGRISQTAVTTVAYTTSSDYRLKENIAPMTGALDKVAALKPVTYTWKHDGSDGQGFIAHELQAVLPDAVVGEKDAVDEEGRPDYQGIDTSFLVATLTAAIQEQQTIINDLKARITALEGAA